MFPRAPERYGVSPKCQFQRAFKDFTFFPLMSSKVLFFFFTSTGVSQHGRKIIKYIEVCSLHSTWGKGEQTSIGLGVSLFPGLWRALAIPTQTSALLSAASALQSSLTKDSPGSWAHRTGIRTQNTPVFENTELSIPLHIFSTPEHSKQMRNEEFSTSHPRIVSFLSLKKNKLLHIIWIFSKKIIQPQSCFISKRLSWALGYFSIL